MPALNALATALFTATLALVGKIAFDLLARLRERRSVAAALGGEIGAFVGIMIRMNAATNLANFANLTAADRQSILPALNKTPTEFHVFSKVADRVGLLPHQLAVDVIEFYNAFESFRIIFSNFSEPGFVAASAALQDANFKQASDLLGLYASNFGLRDRLLRVARQDIWCLFASYA